jgi:hypothetical protein
MDFAIVVAFLPVVPPILATGAPAVPTTMGRPVLLVQPRTELGGNVFRIYACGPCRHLPRPTVLRR